MLMSLARCFMRSWSNPVVVVHGTNLASILISQKKHFYLLTSPCHFQIISHFLNRSAGPVLGHRMIPERTLRRASLYWMPKEECSAPDRLSQVSDSESKEPIPNLRKTWFFYWENEDIFCSYSAAIQQWYFLRWGNGEDICLGNTTLNSLNHAANLRYWTMKG